MSEKKTKAKNDLITIPSNCHLTTNALLFDGSISEEEFKEMSRFLIGMDKSNRDCSIKFWIGDWIIFGGKKFGLKKYKKTLFWDAGYKVRTLDNLAYVASAIPQSSRHREKLTFGHYQELAPIKDEKERELWLDIAQKWELSVGELREIKSLIALKKNNCPDDRVDCTNVAGYAVEAAIKFGRYLAELFDFKERISIEEFSKIIDEGHNSVRFYGELLIKEINRLLEGTTSKYYGEMTCTVASFFLNKDNQPINVKTFQSRRGEARKKAILMSKLLKEVGGADEEKKFCSYVFGKESYPLSQDENFYQEMGFTEEETEILVPEFLKDDSKSGDKVNKVSSDTDKAKTPIPASEMKGDKEEEVIVIDDPEEWIANLAKEDEEEKNPNDVEKDKKSDSDATDEEIEELLESLGDSGKD